jgi:hypothetical protein
MCFSAKASFASSAVLVATGGLATGFSMRRRDWRFVPFALVPVAFGVQQFCEGVVWVGLHQARGELVRSASLAFLFFALAWWPTWMPLAVSLTSGGWVRRISIGLLVVGCVLAALLAGPVIADPDRYLTVRVIEHHIRYDIDAIPIFQALPKDPVKFVYLLAVGIPLFLYPERRVRVFGVLLVSAALVTKLLADYAYTSVWCFFAALLAVYLAWAARQTAPTPATPSFLSAISRKRWFRSLTPAKLK